jgi:hypothetical protein
LLKGDRVYLFIDSTDDDNGLYLVAESYPLAILEQYKPLSG